MSDNNNFTTICETYFKTYTCLNGANCILKHIDGESVSPSPNSAHTDTGRTFAVLPFSNLRQQTIIKPPPISSNSKLSSITGHSKSQNSAKCKTVNATTTKLKNLNSFNDEFPTLSKSQKKRNRRKGKNTINEPINNEKAPEVLKDTNVSSKPKTNCNICDLCLCPVLHPTNAKLRREHSQQCVQLHEEKMKEELATCRSMDKQCGICFEPVMQKKGDCRFAILPDCNHCFCLVCIKIWRKSAGFGKAIRKSCPECRVVSHYVCPNTYWVETKEDKAEVLQNYKATLAQLDCKYFVVNQKCAFGNKCFYKHCKKDGTPVDLGSPRRNRMRGFHSMRHQRDFMMDALFDMIMNNDSDDNSDDFDNDYSFDLENSFEDDADDEDNDDIGLYP